MPWFGGNRNNDEDNINICQPQESGCDRCFPSKASPIVVKVMRPVNRTNYGYGNRFASNRGDCCKWCNHKGYANQMVSNENRILNFDLINRINDARQNETAANVTFSPQSPDAKPEKRKCDNCIKILREKELQLLKKEQEILKIKTHFTNLPKSGAQSGLGTNCEHCFKALREKEFELFRKEQELAKLRLANAKSPIDTKAKADRARCDNCFKALRQKELELIKKEHALMKNMTRPNINVKNLNYCSCCRDNKKSTINKAKKDEEMRKKNRDNCFKALRMKEIQLLQKEREIEKKIQKFREESIAKAKKDLEKVPDPKLVVPTDKGAIKCVCSCSGSKSDLFKESERRRGLCKLLYNKMPTALGGRRKVTQPVLVPGMQPLRKTKSDNILLPMKLPTTQTCAAPCCAMKLATNFVSYLVRPPGSKKQKKLPASCSFMKLLPWCSPGNLGDTNAIRECCTIGSDIDFNIKKGQQQVAIPQLTEKQARKRGDKAIKAMKAASKKFKTDEDYRVETIGQIRPGDFKSKSTPKRDIVEAEVLRTYGPKGLEIYKAQTGQIPIEMQGKGSAAKEAKDFKMKLPKTSKSKGDFETEVFKGYREKDDRGRGDKGLGDKGYKAPKKIQSRVGDIEIKGSKTLDSKPITKMGGGFLMDDRQARQTVPQKFEGKSAKKFKTEVNKTKVNYGEAKGLKKYETKDDYFKGQGWGKGQERKDKDDYFKTGGSKKLETKTEYGGAVGPKSKATKKFMPEVGYGETKRISKYKSEAAEEVLKDSKRYKDMIKSKEDYEQKLPKKYRTEIEDDEAPRRYRSVYDNQVGWLTTGSKEDVRRSVPWHPPPCPNYMRVLGRVAVYCAGCFIGIPCILFLCLCFLCSTCSD